MHRAKMFDAYLKSAPIGIHFTDFLKTSLEVEQSDWAIFYIEIKNAQQNFDRSYCVRKK